jgi:hypothetical protein
MRQDKVKAGSFVTTARRTASFVRSAIEEHAHTLVTEFPVVLSLGCLRDIMGQGEVETGSFVTTADRTASFICATVEEHTYAFVAELPIILYGHCRIPFK